MITEIEENQEQESSAGIANDKEPTSSGRKPPRPRDNLDRHLKSETTSIVLPIKNPRKASHSPYQIGRATVTNFKASEVTNHLSSRNGNDSDKSMKGVL